MIDRPPLFFPRSLPEGLEPLAELALDLRWTWSHATDNLWKALAPDIWESTQNPWLILQIISQARLEQLAGDPQFKAELQHWVAARQDYQRQAGWFRQTCSAEALNPVAYFSMEFGLAEALPLYAGGLGILAGDYLKTASDLDVPLVGVGLLYQGGYFRQILDGQGWQMEAYPYNDPTSLPIRPVMEDSRGWLRVSLEMPGRTLRLRVWQVQVGRVRLYLLDSNDPLNSAADRGITGKLYDNRSEVRLLQEMVLGIGGWRVLEALGIQAEVCHLNEGHAAFVVLERARSFMQQTGAPFPVALWATRTGNVFTTHTPVAAGFDTFSRDLISWYFPAYLKQLGLSLDELLALGRRNPDDPDEPFNMTMLAIRGSIEVNGVSHLHGAVSRQLFQPLWPGWPEHEVPVGFITNGVHVPSWDSKWADAMWTQACGKGRWTSTLETHPEGIACVPDTDLWSLRANGRHAMIHTVRQQLARQLCLRGADSQTVKEAEHVLDPNLLTIGFARRFTAYKRPNLLLHDPDRLMRILSHPEHPVQLIVAGKAHPQDEEGKRLVQQFVRFANQSAVRRRVVFLEDYDMALAERLVQGIDLWTNTPRRLWEACGTSGMKVLVNGGLNLSELDGWWAEAYTPEVGWALGDGGTHPESAWDAMEAANLYELLEQQIIPEFYDRDPQGIPVRWVRRMRASMAQLTPRFSTNRMLREYVEKVYLPATTKLRNRTADGARLARELFAWHTALEAYWPELRFGSVKVEQEDGRWAFQAPVYLGEMDPTAVRVELYADAAEGHDVTCEPMLQGEKLPGAVNGYLYRGRVPATRAVDHFTLRIIPVHPAAEIPLEAHQILWQR